MNYVLIPIAHGVEFKPVQQDYATPLIERITSYLTDVEKNYVIPLPYNYSIKTNARQMEVFNLTDKGLGNEKLRLLKHTVASDITWSFVVAKNGGDCFYVQFVKDMNNLIQEGLLKYPQSRLLFLGHSQGTQLLFSFLFDFPQQVDCFVSMGSPISMNSGAYPNFGKLPSNLKSWLNFYHDKDFVSSRLQNSHPSSEIANFVVDYQIPSGFNPLFYLPDSFLGYQLMYLATGFLAHVSYWKSDLVAKTLSEKIRQLIYQPF